MSIRFSFSFRFRSVWFVWAKLMVVVVFRYRPRRISDEDAQRPEQLVPIRLEFDVEHHKMRDTFVWNLNGECIS